MTDNVTRLHISAMTGGEVAELAHDVMYKRERWEIVRAKIRRLRPDEAVAVSAEIVYLIAISNPRRPPVSLLDAWCTSLLPESRKNEDHCPRTGR